jgi:hypothetical protein
MASVYLIHSISSMEEIHDDSLLAGRKEDLSGDIGSFDPGVGGTSSPGFPG